MASSMRLEGVAPFGAPVFILVSQGLKTTLLLPRDDRVAYSDGAQSMLVALIGRGARPGRADGDPQRLCEFFRY